MKKYHFPLETVLNYRRHLEDKEKQLLASMRVFYDHERQRLTDVEAEQGRIREELAVLMTAPFMHVETEPYLAYLRRLLKIIQLKRAQLDRLKTQLAKQNEMVTHAYKNRRVLERLEAKLRETHQLAYEKEEQRFVDELQLAKFIDRRRP
ncbi:MAG: flagellar export protein FliJ [Acidobacteria bacterium]|nr:flagellar export protein FliJ [Acidobacteriota bacterium]MBI3657836.1 flagellar export protein FliJ [Acidobacteriota bacterium]